MQKSQRKMKIDDLTGEVIGAAVEMHRALGPGLLESACEECPSHEVVLRGIHFERQKTLPVRFKVAGDGVKRIVSGLNE